ncbi:MAG: ATP-binding cassette domain-containing protein [Deferrisomatales bacterium]|nr:ATP-binding cassette domain-containing protein [Deferrisomatales bacterium]
MVSTAIHLQVSDLTLAYGPQVIQQALTFSVRRGEVFVIMGGSGCGKSTLLRSLVGLVRPAGGRVLFDGVSLWDVEPDERVRVMRRFGVLYQGGALWSSMTLAENIALPLRRYTSLAPARIRELASFKLSLVGLSGFEEYYPAELSGGMRKRAGLARAMALDPEILFFDEPSAGLDPVTARHMDDLILELRDSLGATIVVVTHELVSILVIGDDSVFLDAETKTMIAQGNPRSLRAAPGDPKVREFLTRGEGGNRAGRPGREGERET